MKSVIVHGVLAVVGLGLAWMVWSGGEAEVRAVGEVPIVHCPTARLASVELVNSDKLVQLEVARGDGPKAWFTHTTPAPGPTDKKAADKKPADKNAADKKDKSKKSADKKSADKTPEPPKVQRFAAGKKVDRLLGNLAPLMAVRALGDVPADRLEALELDEPKRTLTISCGGKTHKLAVGATTYGASTRYVRDESGGPIYLVKASLFSDLEMSRARFMQRDLHDFKLPEVETAKVAGRGAERTLLHRDRRNPKGANWVDAAEPDRRNELYGNWLTRVVRLRALEYLAPGLEPGDTAKPKTNAESVVKIAWRGDRTGDFELVKVPGKAPDYFARSHATGGWVKVPATLARQIADDVPTVLGIEVPAAEVPAVPAPAAVTPTKAVPPSPDRPVAADPPTMPKIAPMKIPTIPRIPSLTPPPRPKPVATP